MKSGSVLPLFNSIQWSSTVINATFPEQTFTSQSGLHLLILLGCSKLVFVLTNHFLPSLLTLTSQVASLLRSPITHWMSLRRDAASSRKSGHCISSFIWPDIPGLAIRDNVLTLEDLVAILPPPVIPTPREQTPHAILTQPKLSQLKCWWNKSYSPRPDSSAWSRDGDQSVRKMSQTIMRRGK